MKKTMIAIAACCAVTGTAHAQSSVRLYGLIDQGIGWTNDQINGSKNGKATSKSDYGLFAGNLKGSRWGLTGQEDLGGGLKAVFLLEGGLSLDAKGQAGGMFNRQAYVGLGSDQFGLVTLGRQDDVIVDFVAPFSASNQWAGAIGAHVFDADNFYNSAKENQTLKYMSANHNGLTFGGAVGLGNMRNKKRNDLTFSLGGAYHSGPLAMGVAYLRSKNPAYSPMARYDALQRHAIGARETQTYLVKDIGPGPNNTHIAEITPFENTWSPKQTTQIIALGGGYTFGPNTIGLTYSNVNNKGTPKQRLDTKSIFHIAEVNFKSRVTPALLVGIAYSYTMGSLEEKVGKNEKLRAHQVSLGGQYDLSKRTSVYLTGSAQKAKIGERNVAGLNTCGATNKSMQLGVRAGLLHRF